jgi:hypothetical protein
MSWPPAPWLIVTASWIGSFLLFGLWIIACLAIDRRERQRALQDVNDRAAEVIPLRPRGWVDEPLALAPWPGPEVDDEIIARQVSLARLRAEWERPHGR